MDRGEVWWADLTDDPGTRPVLVVTRSDAVRVRDQIVVAQATCRVRHLPVEVPLSAHADGMPQDCVVNCDMLLTVRKHRLRQYITTLSPARMAEVDAALKFSLGLT